jgi:hypothetical protein
MASMENSGSDGNVVDQAKHTVETVASQAKQGVTKQIELRKERAASTIHGVVDAVRQGGKNLDGPLPALAERAADGIEKVSSFLESHEIRDAVRGVERFARREPALFLGGAVALGLLAGRFLKSSAHHASGDMDNLGYDEADFAGFDDQDFGLRSEYTGYADQEEPDFTNSEPVPYGGPDVPQRTTDPLGINVNRTPGR